MSRFTQPSRRKSGEYHPTSDERTNAKIEATIAGARIYCEMKDQGESFDDFCWSFTNGNVLKSDGRSRIVTTPLSEQISKEMKRRGFEFVGPTIVHACGCRRPAS
jgi:DNA-3-methyladenine glycosylase I